MKTVLIVDDLETFRKPIQVILKKYGLRIIAAKDGVDAFKQMELERPDLILLDLNMPGMDGFTFLTQLRSHEIWASMPVILMTGAADPQDAAKAAALGVVDYLVKASFSLSDLVAKVGRALNIELEQAPHVSKTS